MPPTKGIDVTDYFVASVGQSAPVVIIQSSTGYYHGPNSNSQWQD